MLWFKRWFIGFLLVIQLLSAYATVGSFYISATVGTFATVGSYATLIYLEFHFIQCLLMAQCWDKFFSAYCSSHPRSLIALILDAALMLLVLETDCFYIQAICFKFILNDVL